MSRTTWCGLTALLLATGSAALMAGRWRVLGDEVHVPRGPGTWKITLLVNGRLTHANARLQTATPLDFGHQHVLREAFESDELLDKPPAVRHPERRQVLWSPRPGVTEGRFTARHEFTCVLGVHRPSAPMAQLAKTLYAPPQRGKYLRNAPRIECDHPEISEMARELTRRRASPTDQLEALYQFVATEVVNEPALGVQPRGALECLRLRRGDSGAKSRLLVALCRSRGIPARLVTGVTLARVFDQKAHVWVEAYVRDHWLPMCSFYRHYGKVPASYLVLGFGDAPIARGRHVADLDYAFLAEHVPPEALAAEPASFWKRAFRGLALDALPPPEQRLVEFLLLLPVAALVVCLFRNVVGVGSFGTFAPALLGLAFRELHSLPGILAFVALLLFGWLLRRVLDRFHLLQVPRTAAMLTLVVVVLILLVVAANHFDLPATRYIPLFPIVILTSMIERFWTLEVEDGAAASFRTLLGTLLIAATIAVVVSWPPLVEHLFRFPETLGFVLAAQIAVGRYTGYRLSELFRFREFLLASEA